MKNFKKIAILFMALIFVFSAITTVFAEMIYNENGYLYTYINNELVSLYGVSDELTDLVIPSLLNTRRLVDVSNRAFFENEKINSVDFSQAQYLERIGSFAFNGCTNLGGSIILPSNIVEIDTAAFQDCNSITAVDFQASTGEVPNQCFNRCTSLSSVTLSDTVTKIGFNAFSDCTSLTYMEIPKTVTSISGYAFTNDTNLTLGVYYNSTAHQYAENKGISYIILDPPVIPTEPPTEAPTEAPTEPVTPTEEPTIAPTQQPTETTGYYLGDVNGDNTVDVIDSTLIQRYLASVTYPETCVMMHGDVDGDGVVTILDATYIGRYNARIDVRYPIGEWQAE